MNGNTANYIIAGDDYVCRFLTIVQITALFIQIVVTYKVGKMGKKATDNSANQTKIINKNQRFAMYDNDLNSILLEFLSCYEEVLGLEQRLREMKIKFMDVDNN